MCATPPSFAGFSPAALFLVPASALWALLPVLARQQLAQGASGYGLLLGALGVGAVVGAFTLPWGRAKLSSNALLATASAVYAAVLVGLGKPHTGSWSSSSSRPGKSI